MNSFRPISNLSFLSKLVERAAADRLKAHFDSQQLLPCRQSAYRAHHSTETPSLPSTTRLLERSTSVPLSTLSTTRLSSVCLPVAVVSESLVRSALDWCSSYLNQRSQTFQVEAHQSGPHAIDCSVPQGSVLGPLTFISYTEDSADLITSYQLGYHYHLYAEDTQLIGSTEISNVPSTIGRLQRCVGAIGDWCASRRLQLNPLKTELMWFGSRVSLRKIAAHDLSLRIGSNVINPVDVVRDLGVTFDSQLTMQRHINKVASACFHHIRRLKQIRRLLGPDETATLVSAFI